MLTHAHRLSGWSKQATAMLAAIVFLGPAPTRAVEPVDFNRDIRPLLSDRCFACHGPDDASREGELRFDLQDSAFGTAESGERPIVPNKPDESELIKRLTSADEDLRMPPADSKKTLSPEEIELFRLWIEQGANWESNWSLVVPVQSDLPQMKQSDWARNPLDHFVLARLEREGLLPSAAADKATLIRRVTFDLTGLPPTLVEVDAFLADDSPQAFEKVVDRLLKSDRYGEHMARFWLDAARYGDTHGLHLDNYREMWPYRDWVIAAFNANKPYDQFTIEQLAGDLLPNPTLDQIIATGFNRAHVTTSEGGSIKEEVYVRNVVDRVVTTGTVFMGMTFECSRCHDHKFDPFTMNDFYSMFAFFNSLDGNPLDGNKKDPAPVVKASTDEQRKLLAGHDQRIAEMETRVAGPWPEVDQLQVAWEGELISALAASSEGKTTSTALTLGDWHLVGPFSETKLYLFKRKQGPEGKPIKLDEEFTLNTGEKVKWMRRPELTDGKPHTGFAGEVAANFLYRTITAPTAREITISLGSDDALKVYLNGKQVLAKDVARGVAPDQDILELTLAEGENHLLLKVMNYGGATGFYFALKSDKAAVPEEIVGIIQVAAAERSDEQQKKLREYYRNKVADFEALETAQDALAKERESRAAVDRQIPTTLVFRETKEPREAFYLRRGEYDQRGDKVTRATPVALPPMNSDLPMNRLGFAKWLVDPSHPLTARVAVNRFWQQMFGTGIVKTSEDFGSQGETPSHPELLDWLAVQLVQDGWDMKATMKRIVSSATYQQSSRLTPDLIERDPENRLYARGPRFRLDAEMLRDQALAVSGLLVNQIGGPGVKPPQPEGLWFAVGYSGSNTVRFVADKGSDKVHRRTLYTFVKRTSPPPQMSTFDGPSREACIVRRERTNTPLQALLMLNDPQFVEASLALATRVLRDGGETDASRAAYLFRLCTARTPDEGVVEELVQAIADDRAAFKTDIKAAQQLTNVGESPGVEEAAKFPTHELAAWTIAASVMLNLDEVVSKN